MAASQLVCSAVPRGCCASSLLAGLPRVQALHSLACRPCGVWAPVWAGTKQALVQAAAPPLPSPSHLWLCPAPHVPQFLGACTKKEPYILVTELMSGGSLADAFRRPQVFPMRRAVEIALDSARGLAYLHHRQAGRWRLPHGSPVASLELGLLGLAGSPSGNAAKGRAAWGVSRTAPQTSMLGSLEPLALCATRPPRCVPRFAHRCLGTATALPVAATPSCRKPNPIIHRDLKPGNLMLSGGQYQDQMQIVFDTGVVKLVIGKGPPFRHCAVHTANLRQE